MCDQEPPDGWLIVRLFDETGLVSDCDGVQWECRWQRLEGYPISKTTRVHLRPPGSEIDTHFVDAPWMSDIFHHVLIDGDFEPLELSLGSQPLLLEEAQPAEKKLHRLPRFQASSAPDTGNL